jgi:predicted Fe-S protein YdhL (DUF1289 family)
MERLFPLHPQSLIFRRIAAMPAPIASPCTKVCTIDPASGLCRGCGRNLDEIARWMSLSESERVRIMAELPRRRASAGLRPGKRSA